MLRSRRMELLSLRLDLAGLRAHFATRLPWFVRHLPVRIGHATICATGQLAWCRLFHLRLSEHQACPRPVATPGSHRDSGPNYPDSRKAMTARTRWPAG